MTYSAGTHEACTSGVYFIIKCAKLLRTDLCTWNLFVL